MRYPKRLSKPSTVTASAVAIVFVLAGCQSAEPGSTSVSSPSPEDSVAAERSPTAEPAPSEDPSAALIEAAQEEGNLVWYSVVPISQRVADAFTEEYGITVELLRAQNADVTSRFANETESGAPSADVVTTSDIDFFISAYENGWTRELTTEYVPSIADFPEDTVQPGFVAALTIPFGLEWNTECFDELELPPLEGYEDLLDPKLQGQIVLQNFTNSASGTANMHFLLETYGEEYMRALGDQGLILVDSMVPGVQQLAAGDGCVLITVIPGIDAELKEAGAPLEFFVPSDTVGFSQFIGVAAEPQNPAAAQLFAQFVLSEGPGQEAFVLDTGVSPLGDVVPGGVDLPSGLVLLTSEYQTEALANRELLVELLQVN